MRRFSQRLAICLVISALIQQNNVAGADSANLPSFELIPGTRSAWAVSADGSTVIGTAGFNAYRWSRSSGLDLLGSSVDVKDLSGDGQIVVGVEFGQGGLRRSSDGKALAAPKQVIEVRGASLSADALAGSFSSPFGREAYRWTEATGRTALGDLPGGSYFSVAEAISGDGSAVVGQSGTANGAEPFLWTNDGGIRALGDIRGGPFNGRAFDISDDGTTVVGLRSELGVDEAFAWTESGGRLDLGDLPGGRFYSFAHGVSRDGSVVVGVSEDELGQTGFVWDRIHGMRKLQDVLSSLGIETAARIYEAWDVSADGRTIIGAVDFGGFNFQGFIAVLPFAIPEPTTVSLLASSLFALARRRVTLSSPGAACCRPCYFHSNGRWRRWPTCRLRIVLGSRP